MLKRLMLLVGIIFFTLALNGCYTVMFNVEDEEYTESDSSSITTTNIFIRSPQWYSWEWYQRDWIYVYNQPHHYNPFIYHWPQYGWNHKKPHKDKIIVVPRKPIISEPRRDGGVRRNEIYRNPSFNLPKRAPTTPENARMKRETVVREYNQNTPRPPVNSTPPQINNTRRTESSSPGKQVPTQQNKINTGRETRR